MVSGLRGGLWSCFGGGGFYLMVLIHLALRLCKQHEKSRAMPVLKEAGTDD